MKYLTVKTLNRITEGYVFNCHMQSLVGRLIPDLIVQIFRRDNDILLILYNEEGTALSYKNLSVENFDEMIINADGDIQLLRDMIKILKLMWN